MPRFAEIAAAPLQQPDADWHHNLSYWAVVGGVTVLATLFEIAFLYWDSLRSVHNLARAAGVKLFGGGEVGMSMRNTMCNPGSVNIPWNAAMQPTHPFFGFLITWILIRVKFDRKLPVGFLDLIL